MNFRKTTGTVEAIHPLADASGAPAIVTVGRYKFALDKLGARVSCTGLNASGSAREQVRAAAAARAAYVERLGALTSAAWHKANRAMYADLV